MRLLGIDYGTKKVGVAMTDLTGVYPAPYQVLPNNQHLVSEIEKICQTEKIDKIVVGDPINFKKVENEMRAEVKKFAEELAQHLNLPVDFENEFYTSKEAERIIGRDDMYDARAAALILRSYIDRMIKQK